MILPPGHSRLYLQRKVKPLSSLICCIYWVVLALNHYFTGIVSEKKKDEDDEDGYPESRRNTVRSSVDPNSDSD